METDSPRLVGFEIDRCSVRAIVLSPDGIDIVAYADSSVMEPGATDDPFPNPGLAISSIWNKLELNQYRELRVAVSFGSSQSGIGSGQLIGSWIDAMAEQLGEPIAVVAHENDVVSYAPQAHINIVRHAFQTVGCEPSVIELAPTSVGRMLVARPSCALTIGSAAAWRVRIHDGRILEAVSYPGRVSTQGVAVEYFGQPAEPLSTMLGVAVPGGLLRAQQLTVGMLAVAVGAATSLLDPDPVGNFCSVLTPLPALATQEGSLEASSNGDLADSVTNSNDDSEAGIDALIDDLLVGEESSVDKGVVIEPGSEAGVSGEAGRPSVKVATSQDIEPEAPSENSSDVEPVSAAKSLASGPPMPDEQLLTQNFVQVAPGLDPTTTAAMTAPPPPLPVGPETSPSSDDQAKAEKDLELAEEKKFDAFMVKHVVDVASDTSLDDKGLSSSNSAVAVGNHLAGETAKPMSWPPESRLQGNKEKAASEGYGVSTLSDPVDTQPVPPLAGIQAHLDSTAVDRFAQLPTSAVDAGRSTVGFSNGGQASGDDQNKTLGSLAEVGVGLQARRSVGRIEESAVNELAITGVASDEVTAHLEAQLAEEQAWRAAPVNDIHSIQHPTQHSTQQSMQHSMHHSIQQPGERRTDPDPALSLWPFVLLGFGAMLAVAAVLYIWQVAF